MDKGNKRPTAQNFKEQGNTAFKQGDFEAAIEHYTSAIKADPSDHVLPCNRAFARLKLHQWKLAEADCTRSLELLPEVNCKALFRRGTARKRLGKWTNALEDLTAALALEPSNPSIRAELDAVKLHLKKSDSNRSGSSPKRYPVSETQSAVSSSTSDSEIDDTDQPLPGSSCATTRQSSDASNNGLLRELSTTRFADAPGRKSSVDVPLGGNSFADLKDLRNRKEQRSSGFMNPHNGFSTLSNSELSHKKTGVKDIKQKCTTSRFSTSSSSNKSILVSPVTSFSDFEMKWGSFNEPESRLSVLEALDHRKVTELFGEHLEPETLEQIIEAVEVCLNSNEKDRVFKAVNLMQAFDQVPRIGTLAMFLQPEHKKVIKDLLVKYESFEQIEPRVKLYNFGNLI